MSARAGDSLGADSMGFGPMGSGMGGGMGLSRRGRGGPGGRPSGAGFGGPGPFDDERGVVDLDDAALYEPAVGQR